MPDIIKIALFAVLGLIVLVGLIIILNFLSVWIRAVFSGARVTCSVLIALRLRNVPVGLIVDNRITAPVEMSRWWCSH